MVSMTDLNFNGKLGVRDEGFFIFGAPHRDNGQRGYDHDETVFRLEVFRQIRLRITVALSEPQTRPETLPFTVRSPVVSTN